MVVFSSLKWLFSSDKEDPKHLELLHPLIVSLLGNITTWVVSSKLTDIFEKKYPFLKNSPPVWGRKYLIPFIIGYLILMIITRYSKQGNYALYEMLWGCNLAMVMVNYYFKILNIFIYKYLNFFLILKI